MPARLFLVVFTLVLGTQAFAADEEHTYTCAADNHETVRTCPAGVTCVCPM